eukprot:GAHX01002311.1.p1 GENE.GAHX01002311.1~~GAHX01002311.1.p1  ORF type:complete len:238 (-),score=49.90 GAHX01002311.1:58-771(-)
MNTKRLLDSLLLSITLIASLAFAHEVGEPTTGTTGTISIPTVSSDAFCRELFDGCKYRLKNETLVLFGNNAINTLYGRTYLALLGQSETEVMMDLLSSNDFLCDAKSKTIAGDFEFFDGVLMFLHETLNVRDVTINGTLFCEIEFVDTQIINNIQNITVLQQNGFIIDECFTVKIKLLIKKVEDLIDTDGGDPIFHIIAGVHLNMRLNCNEQPSVYENLMSFQLEKLVGDMANPFAP